MTYAITNININTNTQQSEQDLRIIDSKAVLDDVTGFPTSTTRETIIRKDIGTIEQTYTAEDGNILVRRAFREMQTGFGLLTMTVERKNYSNRDTTMLSIYTGGIDGTFEGLGLDALFFHTNGVAQIQLFNDSKRLQFHIGHNPADYLDKLRVEKSVWEQESNYAVHGFEQHLDDGFSGVILLDGTITYEKDTENFFPEGMYDAEELPECDSKAYFGNQYFNLLIMKDSNAITIAYKEVKCHLGSFELVLSDSFESNSNGRFTFGDFILIIYRISQLDINVNLRHYAVSELICFVNIHYCQNKLLKPFSYDDLLLLINRPDLADFVEKSLLPLLAYTFGYGSNVKRMFNDSYDPKYNGCPNTLDLANHFLNIVAIDKNCGSIEELLEQCTPEFHGRKKKKST